MYTYDVSLSTAKDHARQLLGDTGEDTPQTWLLTDETILAKLAAFPYSEAVAQLALGLASRFAQHPDQLTDEARTSMKWSERVAQWVNLAQTLRSGNQKDELTYTGSTYTSGNYVATPANHSCPSQQVDSSGNRIPRNVRGIRL